MGGGGGLTLEHLGQRHGLAEEVTLQVRDTQIGQTFVDGGVVDVFGHGTQLQALGHPHGGEDDLLVDGVGHQVAHEGAVDLQVVERETLQVLEGGQAGAEVVQRDAEALGLQVVHQSGGGRRVADGLAFGDLEDHLGGRNGVVGALLADEVGDGVVAHRGTGQVDRALPRQCQCLGIGGQPLEGQADHAAVQRHRHLGL